MSYLACNVHNFLHSFGLVVSVICIGHKFHSFVLVMNITCIGHITSYLACNVRPILHIYSSSDGVQPKTSHFSTHYLIWVNYKVVSLLYQPIFLSFSYLNSARYFSVTELCRELFYFILFFVFTVLEKIDLQFFRYLSFAFSIMQISIFISPESSWFCV